MVVEEKRTSRILMEEEEQSEGVRSQESVNGGTDVWSSSDSLVAVADHLVVMVHGILGSTTDWKFAADQFVKTLPDKVIVHCSERNMHMLTLDGVDIMGERLADEVIQVIKRRPQLRKISFVAHSIGGLVARYAIGRLFKPPKSKSKEDSSNDGCQERSEGTIYGLEAMNFITVATPHLGSRGNKQVPFLFGVPAIEKFAASIIHWIFKRTGRHLFLTDDNDGKRPLLLRMVNDCDPLRSFKRRVAYANVGFDHIVGWRTSSIRRNCELPKWEDPVNENYPHIVREEFSSGGSIDKCAHVTSANCDCDALEDELVTGLTSLSWERVDVSFHRSLLRFAAHSHIQVKDTFMHSEGTDVVQHIIDHFVL